MKQLTAAVLASILFCACDTQPQSNSMALELSDTKIIKDIYILQCTKLKIGCLICKYRIFL